MQKETFQLLAQYNRWMNENLFAASAKLSEEALKLDSGAFFGSLLGTLNHIMVGDIIWLKRFAQGPHDFPSLRNVDALPVPDTLDAMIHESLISLHEARRTLDADIVSFCGEVSTQQLEEKLHYKNFKGESYRDQLGLLVQHLFNHQTHHRGQATTLLSQSNIDVGPTDLLVCIRGL